MEKRDFIKQFIKDRKMIGAMRPSSRFLTSKMLNTIDFDQAKVLVELGPGTGVFTTEIIARMRPDAHLLVFEINDNFFEQLKKKLDDPRIHLINDSAENIAQHLTNLKLNNADVIISSLPLANFSKQLRTSIVQNAKLALNEGGKFIQFQYSLQSKKMLHEEFSDVQTDFTVWNFPPAFVFSCSK